MEVDLQGFVREQLMDGWCVAAQEEVRLVYTWRELQLQRVVQDGCTEMQGWGVGGGQLDVLFLERGLPLSCIGKVELLLFVVWRGTGGLCELLQRRRIHGRVGPS